VKEHLCIAVAACVLEMKKRKVKEEFLHIPLADIAVFSLLVVYKVLSSLRMH
jgi:hypothetical protein